MEPAVFPKCSDTVLKQMLGLVIPSASGDFGSKPMGENTEDGEEEFAVVLRC